MRILSCRYREYVWQGEPPSIYGDSIHVFDRPIEQTIKVAECPAAGVSILDYAPKNPAADSYRSLAQEVLRLG